MPYNNKIKRLVRLFSAFTLIALITWISLYVWARALDEEFHQGETALAGEGQKELYYKEITKVLRDTNDEQAVLRSYFISAGEEASFLESIESLARQSNVELKIFGFEKRETTLRTSLQFNGSFEDVYYFIALVESMPVKLSINKASLEEIPSEEEGKVLWEGRFDLDVLSYLPSITNTPE